MLEADDFISAAKAHGHGFYSGVPCSTLSPLINGVLSRSDVKYVGASSEGEAVAISAGAWLAGRRASVLCQNSGLGNAVNPLTSLNVPFRIPVLLVTSWRGMPGQIDEPQHTHMGKITRDLLDVLEIPHALFPSEHLDLRTVLIDAFRAMERTQLPSALVIAEGMLRPVPNNRPAVSTPAPGKRVTFDAITSTPVTRIKLLEAILALSDDESAIVATTGKCGRELFTLSDRQQHLYMVGAMGCAAPLALGIALNSSVKVVVLDGDGAALMKMGTFATIGSEQPPNLLHIVIDNGVHDSTGGQATAPVDFAGIALACGYRFAASCGDLWNFEKAYVAASRQAGPACIHVRIAPGSISGLGRPTISPDVVARRFQAFLAKFPKVPLGSNVTSQKRAQH